MPLITARTVCEAALELVGVAAAEQPIPAEMAARALQTLNTMLDGWATERILTYTRPKRILPLAPGKQAYTWGVTTPPADIPGEPPVRLELATLLIQSTPAPHEWPLRVIDQTEYEAGVWDKTFASTYVEMVYLEASQPVNRLHCFPVPLQAQTAHLFPWQASAPYERFDHALPWPNGYEEAMIYNLAPRLASRYGMALAPEIRQIADDSKRLLGNVNARVGRLTMDYGWVTRGHAGFPAVDMAAFYRGY